MATAARCCDEAAVPALQRALGRRFVRSGMRVVAKLGPTGVAVRCLTMLVHCWWDVSKSSAMSGTHAAECVHAGATLPWSGLGRGLSVCVYHADAAPQNQARAIRPCRPLQPLRACPSQLQSLAAEAQPNSHTQNFLSDQTSRVVGLVAWSCSRSGMDWRGREVKRQACRGLEAAEGSAELKGNSLDGGEGRRDGVGRTCTRRSHAPSCKPACHVHMLVRVLGANI